MKRPQPCNLPQNENSRSGKQKKKKKTKTAAAETRTTEGSTTATPITAEAAATTAKTNSKGRTAKYGIQTQQETNGDKPQYQENMKEKNITPKKKSRQIIIAGDSIIKGLKGWMMARDNRVKVHSFSGATAI